MSSVPWHSLPLLLNSSRAFLDSAQALQIKFGTALKGIDAILYLVDSCELGVAVAEHGWMIQQGIEQPHKALIKLLKGMRSRAVAPAGRSIARIALGVPPDATKFAYHIGLMAIGHRDRTAMMVVGKRFARFQMRMLGGKSSRVVLVSAAIVHIGFWHTMTITPAIHHWPR